MTERTGNYTKQQIKDRFSLCFSEFLEQQEKNIRSAAIVNISKVKDFNNSPLFHIHRNSKGNRDPLGLGLLSSMFPVQSTSRGTTIKVSPNDINNRTILESIVNEYLQNVDVVDRTKNKIISLFKKEFSYTNCLFKDGSEQFSTEINFVSSNLEKDIRIAPRITTDRDELIVYLLGNSKKNNIVNATLEDKKLLEYVDGAIEMCKKYFELYFDSDIYNDLVKDEDTRKSCFEDFVLYGYCGLEYKKIIDKDSNFVKELKLVNIPCSKFMYLKDDDNDISFLVKSYYEYDSIFNTLKDERIACFDIFIHNKTEQNYDHYTCKIKCETTPLNTFLNNANINFTYEGVVFDLPITIFTNDMTLLYGNPKQANYFQDAIELKLCEWLQKYLVVSGIFPPQLLDATLVNNSVNTKGSTGVLSENDTEAKLEFGSVTKVNSVKEDGNNHVANFASILQTTTGNAGDLLSHRIMYLSKKLSTMFHNTDLMQFKSLSGANMLNGKKMIDNILTNLHSEYQLYRKLLDASVNLSFRKNIIQEIQKCNLILNNRINYKDKNARIFLQFLYDKLTGQQESIDYDIDSVCKLWCFYLLLNFDAESISEKHILLNNEINLENIADSELSLYNLFIKLENIHNCKIKWSITSNTEYTIESAKDILTDIANVAQVMTQFGMSPPELINTKEILNYLRKTELGFYINTDEQIEEIVRQLQKTQQQEQDNFNATLEAQSSKNKPQL